MKYRLLKTPEYDEWIEDEQPKSRFQIAKLLEKIESEGHFGTTKLVGDETCELWELKWPNGRRVYYVKIPVKNILLLLGGNKNGQNKDINQAKKIFKKYYNDET